MQLQAACHTVATGALTTTTEVCGHVLAAVQRSVTRCANLQSQSWMNGGTTGTQISRGATTAASSRVGAALSTACSAPQHTAAGALPERAATCQLMRHWKPLAVRCSRGHALAPCAAQQKRLLSLCAAGIEQRIADWVLIPQENFEGLRLTRYPLGRKFHTHWDNAHTDGDMSGGAQYATVLMYLSTVEKGGETVSVCVCAGCGSGSNLKGSHTCHSRCMRKPRMPTATAHHQSGVCLLPVADLPSHPCSWW